MKSKLLGAAMAVSLSMVAAGANALTIGVFSENGAAEAAAGGIVTGQGHTFVNLANLSAASLTGLDIAWYMNSSNGVQGQAGNAAALAAFVGAGNVFVMNDREVDNAETILPGGGGFTITRLLASNIDVLDNSTSLTNGTGPGGIINNTTLDGGNFSNHGFSVSGSLPGMALNILSTANPAEIVDFTYMFSAGAVHYSTIPLDFYMTGGGANANFLSIYAPNLVGYAAETWEAKNLPEPGTLVILGLGLVGLGLARRKRAA